VDFFVGAGAFCGADRGPRSFSTSAFAQMLTNATFRVAPSKVLFMLTVHLDESGQESPEHVAIAGFAGTDEQWKSFTPDWQKGLAARGASLDS
jgi:hypothetical protein